MVETKGDIYPFQSLAGHSKVFYYLKNNSYDIPQMEVVLLRGVLPMRGVFL